MNLKEKFKTGFIDTLKRNVQFHVQADRLVHGSPGFRGQRIFGVFFTPGSGADKSGALLEIWTSALP